MTRRCPCGRALRGERPTCYRCAYAESTHPGYIERLLRRRSGICIGCGIRPTDGKARCKRCRNEQMRQAETKRQQQGLPK